MIYEMMKKKNLNPYHDKIKRSQLCVAVTSYEFCVLKNMLNFHIRFETGIKGKKNKLMETLL